MRVRTLVLANVVLAATLITAFACSSSDEESTSTGGGVSLEQDDYYFQPTTFSGEAGKPLQITLKNEGKATHTFTIDSLSIDQTVSPDQTKTVTVTPKAGGDLTFYCRFHHKSNNMQGTLKVSGAPGGAANPTASKSSGGGYSGGGY